jgi:hypothetical protein
MKKLLIGLLLLGSTSAFADYCLVATKKVKYSHILQGKFERSRFIDSDLISRSGVATEYGIKQESRQIETGQRNAFGEMVTHTETWLALYQNGSVIFSTGIEGEDENSIREVMAFKLKELGCD